MVDTVRTLSALQTLLADNTVRGISAQDLRDMLVSVYPAAPFINARTDYGATGDGATDDTTALQNAINAWTAANQGTLHIPPGIYLTTSELTCTFIKVTTESQYPMVLDAYGAMLYLDATMDYGITFTVAQTGQVAVANSVLRGLAAWRKSGDSGGIRFDGTATAQGWFNRINCYDLFVGDVTLDGYHLQGEFFESQFVNCSARIPDGTESSVYALNITEGVGNISSIFWYGGSLRGGQHCVWMGDNSSFKMLGGTLLKSGEELVKTSGSGVQEFALEGVHCENAWNGPSAVVSGSWSGSTNQAAVNVTGKCSIKDCDIVSSEDTNTACVRLYADGPVEISRVRGEGEFRDCVDVHGSAVGRVLVLASYTHDGGTVANLIKERGSATPYKTIGCLNSDTESIMTLADDATPSILNGFEHWITGGTTTITDFNDGAKGRQITILSEHAVTITDGTNILLHGSANFVMANGDTLVLVQKADGKWYEKSRMVN